MTESRTSSKKPSLEGSGENPLDLVCPFVPFPSSPSSFFFLSFLLLNVDCEVEEGLEVPHPAVGDFYDCDNLESNPAT